MITDDQIAQMERDAQTLRDIARKASDASWALDSALSMLRKAKSGYRDTTLLGDGAWNVAEYERRLQAVYAERVLTQRTVLAALVSQPQAQR